MTRALYRKLAFGTAQWGGHYGISNKTGPLGEKAGKEVLALGRQKGMDTIDTARSYGGAEDILGRIGVADWRIVTKLARRDYECEKGIAAVEQAVEDSRKKLGINQFYAILVHHASDLLSPQGIELWAGLERAKEKRLTQKIGFSVYSPCELACLLDRHRPDIIQCPLSIFDRRWLKSGALERARALGIEVHARSIFLQGLLLMKKSERPEWFDRWNDLFRAWEEWLTAQRVSALEACIHFVIESPYVDRVIVGVETVNQAKEIFDAVEREVPMPPDTLSSEDEDLLLPFRWMKQ